MRRQSLSFLADDCPALSELSVLENIKLPLSLRGGGKRATEAAFRWAETLGISGILRRKPPQISSGQRRLMCIARTMASDTQVLVLDEPTSSLDGRQRQLVMSLVQGRKEAGRTVVFSTHSVSDSCRADRLVLLREGKIAHDVRLGDHIETNLHTIANCIMQELGQPASLWS
jgi:ABC-type lipoprotein export system ATPase subunit